MKKRIIILSAIILLAGLVGLSLVWTAVEFRAAKGVGDSFFGLFIDYVKENGLFLGAIWLVCVLLTCFAVSLVFAPLSKIAESKSLGDIHANTSKCKELSPVFDRLSFLEESLRDREGLMNKLDSGVLIMTSATEVGLINHFAARLLGYHGGGKLAYFMQDEELYRIVRSGRDAQIYRKEGGRLYSFNFEFGNMLTVLISDITVLKRAEIDRERLVVALNEVVAPLATISGYAELIRGGMKEQNVKDAAAIISDEVRRISSAAKHALSE